MVPEAAQGRRQALVVGHPKRLADEAFAGFAEDFHFVNLSDVSDVSVESVSDGLLAAVDRVMARQPFSAVVATSESTILTAGLLRSRYGLPGPRFDDALVVTNKWRMRSTLRAAVRSPRAWLSGEFLTVPESDGMQDDVVVKPLASSSARGVRRMDAAAARAWLAEDGGLWLVEQAIDVVREFHCDGAFTNGQVEWVEVSEYDRPVLVSHGTRTTTILSCGDALRDELVACASDVVRALAVPEGVFHMEFLYDGRELYFGEVGLRPAGTGIAELLHIATGAGLWSAFVAAQLGRTSVGFNPVRVAPELTGLVMARPSTSGIAPIPPDEARGLPGVVSIGEGNIGRGTTPGHMCEFEYLAFFSGLTAEAVARLRERIAPGEGR